MLRLSIGSQGPTNPSPLETPTTDIGRIAISGAGSGTSPRFDLCPRNHADWPEYNRRPPFFFQLPSAVVILHPPALKAEPERLPIPRDNLSSLPRVVGGHHLPLAAIADIKFTQEPRGLG